MTETDITSVIHCVVADMGDDPYEINSGRCEELMQRVLKAVPEAEERCSAMVLDDPMHPVYGGHVWVYHNGKHYDAEAPDGVTDWKDLPFMQRKEQQQLDADPTNA